MLELLADFSSVFTDLWNRSRFGHGGGVVTAYGVGRKAESVSVARHDFTHPQCWMIYEVVERVDHAVGDCGVIESIPKGSRVER